MSFASLKIPTPGASIANAHGGDKINNILDRLRFMLPFAAVIDKDGSTTYAYHRDGTLIDSDTDASNVINSVAQSVTGLVFIRYPGSHYMINAEIVIPKDQRIRWMGEQIAKDSLGGPVFKANTTLTNMFNISGNASATSNTDLSHSNHFEHITFDGNNTITNGIYAKNTDELTFTRCRIVNFVNPIKTDYNGSDPPTASSKPGGLTAHNCLFGIGASGYGIDLNAQTQCLISGGRMTGLSSSKGIRIHRSNKIRIIGLEFNTLASCLVFSDDANTPSQDVLWDDCTFTPGSGNKAIENALTPHASSYNLKAGRGNTYAAGILFDTLPRPFEGTATITSAATSVTVTHNQGISFPLGRVNVKLTNLPTNDIGDVYLTSASTNNFVINCRNAPGASGAIFAWSIDF